MPRHALCCCLLALAACAESPPPDPQRIVLGRPEAGFELARQRCTICHTVGDRGAKVGPVMTEAIKLAVERSAKFDAWIAELERTRPDHRETKRAKIDPVLAEQDPERRLRLWLATYLGDPQFDNPKNRMTVLPLDETQRADVLAWLLSLR